MSEYITLEDIDRVTSMIRERSSYQPRVGIILGSGLSPLADEVGSPDVIPYSDLAGWPVSTVHGHRGRLVIGTLEGQTVCVMQGRSHYYEGYSMSLIGLPVRVMNRLGIEILIVTNAAGAINPEFQPGDLMRIIDHLPDVKDR